MIVAAWLPNRIPSVASQGPLVAGIDSVVVVAARKTFLRDIHKIVVFIFCFQGLHRGFHVFRTNMISIHE